MSASAKLTIVLSRKVRKRTAQSAVSARRGANLCRSAACVTTATVASADPHAGRRQGGLRRASGADADADEGRGTAVLRLEPVGGLGRARDRLAEPPVLVAAQPGVRRRRRRSRPASAVGCERA